MYRSATFIFACLGLTGCVSEPGDSLSAGLEPSQPQFVATAGEPITRVAPGAQSSHIPLPPRRPDITSVEVASAPAGEAAEGVTVVSQQSAPAEATPAPMIRASAPAAPDSVQAYTSIEAPASASSPERPQIVRASFRPAQAAAFDRTTRAYGYLPPEREDEGLQMTQDPRSDVPQTVRRSAAPGQLYFAAYSNTEISCFPVALREALNTIAEHYGKEVEVTSGMRHNGRRGSYHRKCMAADIRVPGVGPGALADYAKSIQGVNGVGTYRHNSVTHVDVRDYQMSWRY